MNDTSIAAKLACALVALLLLPCCGLFKPNIGFGSRSKPSWNFGSGSGRKLQSLDEDSAREQPWVAARAWILDLAAEIAREAPDALALRNLATWRRDGDVLHDDVELLLDELWRRGLDYRTANAVVIHQDAELTLRHALLVGSDRALEVVGASRGLYLEGDDGWAAAEIEAGGTTTVLVITGLDGPHAAVQAHELVDALMSATHPCVVACGLDVENPVVDTLRDAGFAITNESPHSLGLERKGDESERP